jgi:hypothetical protein
MVHSRRAERLKAWIGSLGICWIASLPLGSVWASLFTASSLGAGQCCTSRRPSARDAPSLVQERRRHNNVGVPASGGDGSRRAYPAEANAKTGRRSMSRRRHERCWRPKPSTPFC